MDLIKILAGELSLNSAHVKNVVNLLDEGNTVPFIARYRKEMTGSMLDTQIRDLSNRLNYLRNLEEKKEEVIRLIDEQGKLTDEIKEEILKADTLQRVDDLYRPFRPKKRTRATIAKEKGLEGLAEIIWDQNINEDEFENEVLKYIDEEKNVNSAEEALEGAKDIIAEKISDDASIRASLKRTISSKGKVSSIAVDPQEESVYEMYYNFEEAVKAIANHRVLAINRGEKEKKLRVSIVIDDEESVAAIAKSIIKKPEHITSNYLNEAIEDGYKRLLFPSVEREIRGALTEKAEEDAIKVFALNLKPLLMQPPIKNKVVLAIDPGFRTGCKIAVIDDTGKLYDYKTIYPTQPKNLVKESIETMEKLINKYGVELISIGNGTASREVENVIAQMIKQIKNKVEYVIVNEAGASIYSASELGSKEFPDLDVSIRGAVSIGRRLQDPLAELVKIEPKHIGVGQYQHDLNQGKLNKSLSEVVEDAVNTVGVDLNTASPSLLKYVSGITDRVANSIVAFREEEGRFVNRKQLKKIKGLGDKTFVQAAGFLRISEGENPLDNTAVHPESYKVAEKLLKLDYKSEKIEKLAEDFEIGAPTLEDIIKELEKPGRDPRDEMPKPILRQDVLKIEDLKSEMVLKGTVRNVVDFGIFVDIGVKEDGLVHISQMSNKFIKHPKEMAKIGDIVYVKIIEIDKKKGRIGLSMKTVKEEEKDALN